MLSTNVYDCLWYFLKPYKKTFAGMIVSVFLLAIFTTLSPYCMKLIIDRMVAFSGSPSQDLLSVIFIPAVAFVLLYQIMDVCWLTYDYFKLKTLPKVREDIINSLFMYLQGHSHGYFQRTFSGSLSTKVADMARGAELVIAQMVEPLFSQLMALVVAAISLYWVNPLSSLVLIVWSITFLSLAFFFYQKTLKYSQQFSESNSLCMGKLVDSITNILNAKLFAHNDYERTFLKKYVQESRSRDEALQWYMIKIKTLQGTSVTILFGCMVAVLIYAKSKGLVTIGDFAFILSLSMTIMQGLWYLASHCLTFSQELGLCKQALTIINTPYEVKDVPNASILNITRGEIVFDHVSFHYERGKNIFKDKSITIHGGEKVGLVGFSGSGKTTFVNLILRFFDVSAGKILIDGQDISQVTQDSLHAQIAMIPQDPILFHRSLMDNIRYGRLEATDEEVIEASKKAHCHEFAELLSDGYATIVGERGLKLSGGQRQRVAIARAILKNAPLLILDEATSALDSITEQKIRESIEFLMQGRTTLVIAHRLSTLSDMDRILVFMGGQVVEDGTHDELLNQQGQYAKLWEMQAGGFLPEREESGTAEDAW